MGEERLIKAAEKAGITYMGCDTPDWLAEKILELLQENKGLNEYSESRDESIKVYREEIKELKERLKEAINHLDGATAIVEIWQTKSPGQAEWKSIWLQNARQAIKKASDKELP